MKNKLLKELITRFEIDQHLCKNGLSDKLENVYHYNSEWLKKVILKFGWPSDNLVSKKGELCAWLIVQHSDDLKFQKKCLSLIKKLPSTNERSQHIAYLTDRILIKENKKQVYGTQFSNGKLYPINDVTNVNKRRLKIGLNSLQNYLKFMKSNLQKHL